MMKTYAKFATRQSLQMIFIMRQLTMDKDLLVAVSVIILVSKEVNVGKI